VRRLYDILRGDRSGDDAEVEAALKSGDAFWLDIEAPDDGDLALLTGAFHFHPLTIDDIRHQNQRPKLDTFDGYDFAVFLVPCLVGGRSAVRENHLYISARYVVTVHQDPEPAFAELSARIAGSPAALLRSSGALAYMVMDCVVDATFPVLDELDELVDTLQDQILDDTSTVQLSRLQELKHAVSDMRRNLGAQRDMFQRLITHSLDEVDPDVAAYYRDVYDHLIRQYEMVDSLRDLLGGAMDVYLSVVSNRLNSTMKALTGIASVFLPLTFLTGFFGMNFGWLVSRISSFPAFAVGLLLMVGSVVVQLYVFRRRGWI
jgi:magnesium transporter